MTTEVALLLLNCTALYGTHVETLFPWILCPLQNRTWYGRCSRSGTLPYVLRGFSAGYGASHRISTSSCGARLRHAEELLAVGRGSSPKFARPFFQTLPNSVEDVLVLEDVIGLLPTANFRQWS
jgi:hypothetical protein